MKKFQGKRMYDCNPVRGGTEGGMETGIQRKCSINRLIYF